MTTCVECKLTVYMYVQCTHTHTQCTVYAQYCIRSCLIFFLQGVLERLYSSVDMVDVGWICVDQGAVKNALTSLAKKWTYIYANYLEKKVRNYSQVIC